MKNIALITGATGGLGQEFVKLHAQLKGKLNVVSGLTFVQRIFMSMTPLLPKKMMLKQIYDMQTIKK